MPHHALEETCFRSKLLRVPIESCCSNSGRNLALWFCWIWWPALLFAAPSTPDQGEVLSKEGKVDWSRASADWTTVDIGQKLQVQDRVRTLALSRAMVQLADLGRLRLSELTTLEILPPRES